MALSGRRQRADTLPPLDPDLIAARDSAVSELTAQMNKLGDPISDALGTFSGEEFTSLIWQMPKPDRTMFLTDLGVPPVKRPTAVAARLGLAKLHRWPKAKRRRAGTFLTSNVADRLERIWWDSFESGEDQSEACQALLTAVTSNPAQTNVMRLAIVAHGSSRWPLTVALRLGLSHGLALQTWPQERLDGVIAACRHLETVWADIIAEVSREPVHPAGDNVDLDRGGELGMAIEASASTEPVVSADPAANTEPTPEGPIVVSSPIESALATVAVVPNAESHDSVLTAQRFADAAAMLAEHQGIAQRAATALDILLGRGEIPKPAALAPITAFLDIVGVVRDLLEAAGRTTRVEDGVDQLLSELGAASNAVHIDDQRARIATLAGLAGPDSENDRIAGVIALVTALASSSTWSPEQQQAAAGLLALLDLIDAVTAQDSQALAVALASTEQSLPQHLAHVRFAALLGQLRLDPPPAADSVGSSAEQPADTGTADLTVHPVSAPTDSTSEPEHDVAAAPEPADPAYVSAASSQSGIPSLASGTPQPPSEPTPTSTDGARLGTTETTQPETVTAEPGNTAAGRVLVRELLADGRLSLASHAAAACGDPRRADGLRILALAEAVRSETAPTAGALRTALEAEQSSVPTNDLANQLLLLAGAVRACLVTADASAGESVLAITRTMHQLSSLTTLCTTIGTASAHGWLYSPAVLAALAPLAGADNDISTTVEAARSEQSRRRTLEFARANQIVDLWWARTGVIGRLLDAAADDRRSDVGTVAEELRKFAKRQYLDDLLSREDIQLRASSSKPLQGQARRRLREMAENSVTAVRHWVDAVRANQQTANGQEPVPAHLSTLRQEVIAQWPAAEQELVELAAGAPLMLLGEAAQACRLSMQRSVDMLNGIKPSGADRDPRIVLYQELLRSPALPFTEGGVPARDVALDDVQTAAHTTWDEAFEQRLAGEQYATAGLILDAITDPARVRVLRDQLLTAAAETRSELVTLHHEVAAEFARAARLGQLDETASSTASSLLEAGDVSRLTAAPQTQDLGLLRAHLLDVQALLPQYLREAQERLHKRVDNEVPPDRRGQDLVTAIHERIDAGDLATAEEYLLAAMQGEAPPTAEPSADLDQFLQLIDQVPGGITQDLITALRDELPFAGLDLAALSATQRATAVEGLQSWLEIRAARHYNVRKSALIAVLRLAGIEFGPGDQLKDPPATSRRAWWDLIGARRIGDTLGMPQFALGAGERQRIMLCWGDADVVAMFGWIAQDPGTHQTLIVLLLAPMTAAQRTALAQICAQRSEKPVVVLDDIALLHLALHGSGQFATTARTLLPFAATNPYSPGGLAALPEEMFFGRQRERSKIIDANGPNLLYGGRQLGKTALLQDAARAFERVPGQVAVYVSLPNAIGTPVDPLVLWDRVLGKLGELKIFPPRKDRDPVKNVIAAIKAWLEENPAGRMLLLIDECDGFFDADAETGFKHVADLRELRDGTKRRFKPVFAGLHQVQRFAHLPNQPLVGAHLGDQIAIGPLSPEPAYRLLFTPMEALGVRFAADELIHRVLAYCNYQPKLLQLVGEALVTSALARRRRGPFYEITEDDLDQVLGSDDLQQRVRQTVHLTLDLDPRYKLIALVVALANLEHGADYVMSTSALRDDCHAWWPEGFAGQGADEFRSLLEEMRDLGVLAVAAGRQWRLRSANVLRLLGTANEIWEELCSPQWRTTVTKLSAKDARHQLPTGMISPCTDQQLSQLVSRTSGSAVRVVVGSPATGIDRVTAQLQQADEEFAVRFDLVVTNSAAAYRNALRAGEPGGVHRVIVSPPRAKAESVVDAIVRAVQVQPPAGSTRAAVLVVDATQPGILDALTNPNLMISAEDVMPLRRVTGVGLRSWLSESGTMDAFGDISRQPDLLKVTGGWLTLLDRAAGLAREISQPKRICDRIAESLNTVDGASELIDTAGLRTDPRAEIAFQHLVDYHDPVTTDELIELCAEAGYEPQRTARILQMLDVLDQDETDGRWSAEPVIAQAWRLLHTTH